jgi:adenylate kinase family enzyme
VLVAGTSGAGKTTLARRVAEVLGVPHVEIDGLFHGPGWTPREEFVADVERFSSEPAWVTEWQYGAVRALLAERADLLVWLDLPRRTVLRQVLVRTVRRRLRRERLWHGNVEPPLRTVLTDPDHVVRWAWRTHPSTAERVADVPAGLPVVRLRSHAEAARWLAALRQARYGGS